MKVNFIIKGKNNPTNIICRYKPSQKNDWSTTTGIWINREDWSENTQKVKQRADILSKDLINAKLSDLRDFIEDKYKVDFITKSQISKTWLKEAVNNYFGIATEGNKYKVYFLDWVDRFIQNSHKRINKETSNPISYRTVQKYKTHFQKLKAFEYQTKTRLRHEDITANFHKDIIYYLRTVDRLNNNTIGKVIKSVKLWCKGINADGLSISKDYLDNENFYAISSPTKSIYLNLREIDQIKECKPNRLALTNAKDWFIIGLFTGLRVSDLLNLTKQNIKGNYIEVKTQKTGIEVVIPIHPYVKEIILNYNGLPSKISNQKFNIHIKEVVKGAGIIEEVVGIKRIKNRNVEGTYEKWDLVTSHICRRSFVTNLYGKLPNMVIRASTGHKNDPITEDYVKMTTREHSKTLAIKWGVENDILNKSRLAITGYEPLLQERQKEYLKSNSIAFKKGVNNEKK